MSTESGEWATLSPGVIDHIASFLKSTHRWRRDGPSLRRLNRHWCYQLNQRFTVVRPHHCRRFLASDITSLSKFPQVTYLDAVEFSEESSERGVRSAVEAVGKHPAITSLKLPANKLANLSDEDLRHLSRLTSLEVVQTERARKETSTQVMQLPLIQLTTWCSPEELNPLISDHPTLRELTVCVQQKLPEIDVASFNKLDVLHLKSMATQDIYELGKLLSIVSLELELDNLRLDAVPLHQLPRLKRLSLANPAAETFDGMEFTELVKKLEILEISTTRRNSQPINLPNFVDEPIQLRALVLTKCKINNHLLMDNLGHLIHLVIKKCAVDNVGDWLLSMQHLTKLCLTGSRSDGRILPKQTPLLLDMHLHSRLKMLTLGDCGQDGKYIETVAQLEGLEILGLYHQVALRPERYLVIERLPNLRELGLFGAVMPPAVQALMEHDFLAGLEELWLDTSLSGLWEKTELGDINVFRVRLTRRAPHLKITTRGSAYRRFLNKHHFSNSQEDHL